MRHVTNKGLSHNGLPLDPFYTMSHMVWLLTVIW